MLMILLLFLYLLLLSCVTSLFIWLGSIVQHYCSIFIHLTLLFPHLLQIHLGKKTQFWLNLTIIRSLTELKQQYSFVENNTTAFSTYFKIMTTLSDGNSIQPLLFICPNKYTLLLQWWWFQSFSAFSNLHYFHLFSLRTVNISSQFIKQNN